MPVALLPLLAILTAAGEPSLPPPPLLEPPAAGEAPESPLPPALEAPATPQEAPPPGAEPERSRRQDAGLDPWETALVQLGAVAGGGLLLSVPLAYGNALSLGLCGCLVYPTAASYGVVALGNAVGDHEAPLLAPWLASVATGSVSSLVMWGGALGIMGLALAGMPGAPLPTMLLIGLTAAGALCGPGASALAAVATWHLTARPRPPDARRDLPPLWFEEKKDDAMAF